MINGALGPSVRFVCGRRSGSDVNARFGSRPRPAESAFAGIGLGRGSARLLPRRATALRWSLRGAWLPPTPLGSRKVEDLLVRPA